MDSNTTCESSAGDSELRTLRRRAVVSCLIGNLFELYDFGVYAFFAAQIGRAIFSSADPVASILGSFATYGVGFFMRPVGAVAGFAPFISSWLIAATGAPIAPSYYVTACALVSFLVILGLRERAHLPLR